jgi:hypothetical protein
VLFLVEWPGFFPLVEVVFCIWGAGVCPFSGMQGEGGFMAGGSLKGCQRLRWRIWYGRRLGDCWL